MIAEMLARLHLTHYGVIPGSVYQDVEAGSSAQSEPQAEQGEEASGTAGIEVRVIEGAALVFSVEPGSRAEGPRCTSRMGIQAIDDEDLWLPCCGASPQPIKLPRCKP